MSGFDEEWLRTRLAAGNVKVAGSSKSAPRSAKAPASKGKPAPSPLTVALDALASLPRTTPQGRTFALGRLKTGEMNKSESAYAQHLELLKREGLVAWYKFEAIKLRLADNTFLTVDFAVMLTSGELEMHDVKGARAIYQDDAKVKMKVAAEMYPFVFRVAFPKSKKDGGGWDVEEV